MTFKEIQKSAKETIPFVKLEIIKAETELLALKRVLEEQEGMLADATKWLESEY